ncbi:pseudouridine synthase [Corynebacterium confusum]|uniref:pseudouridine synthase n=1 Tax=Corynebacterium confusum TaxID=71254 RepID=UPI0025B4DDDE|nr:pseudouridine synthase [Corynebacterium confusum]WJY90693.1 Ribosomal large subunit pseudouridine synthase A [Corynebacterium confusum]
MSQRIAHHRKGYSPLGIQNGLNPTRVRVPESGITAWDFLAHVITSQRHRHPADDATALQRRFDDHAVVLRDGTVLSPRSILRAGQDVYFYRMPAQEEPIPYDIPVVYEDDNLLVANKPPFMATMPRARHIVQTATVQLRRTTGIDELAPAHRLDRLTSGILLFTKRREIRGAYQTMFAERKVHKVYQAIAPDVGIQAGTVWRSRLEKTPGEIQGRIVEGEPNAETHVVKAELITNKLGVEAVHGSQPPLTRYTLVPTTGKTHQLRLHLWSAGAPILGDPIYPDILSEDAEDFRVPMHLTATQLSFTDPLDGIERTFETTPIDVRIS